MKKFFALLFAFIFILGLASCGIAPSDLPETTNAPTSADFLQNTETSDAAREIETQLPETTPPPAENTELPVVTLQETTVAETAEPYSPPVYPDLLYTYLSRNGIQYSLYPDRICVYFLDDENEYVQFEDIPGNKILQYYSADEPVRFVIGNGTVETTYRYANGGTDEVYTDWTIVGASYMGQSIDLSGVDFEYDAYVGYKIFEADGIFVLSRVYYNYSETYLLTKDSVIHATPDFYDDVERVYNGEPIVFYKGEDGKLHYEKHLEIPMSHFQVLEYNFGVTSRDQYFGEEGLVSVGEGGVEYTPLQKYTYSDYFVMNGTTMDEWFELWQSDRFETIEQLFAYNAIWVFEDVFMEKRKVVIDGEEILFSRYRGASGKRIIDWPNRRMGYVDFDRDGVSEILVYTNSGDGEYILQYDAKNDIIYAYYMHPSLEYKYYEGGEFGSEKVRQRVVEFRDGKIITETVEYTDENPGSREVELKRELGFGGK